MATLHSKLDCTYATLFSVGYLSPEKMGFRYQISWDFLNHYELSKNHKKLGIFTVILDGLEGAGKISPSPHLQQPDIHRIQWEYYLIYALIFFWFWNYNTLCSHGLEGVWAATVLNKTFCFLTKSIFCILHIAGCCS